MNMSEYDALAQGIHAKAEEAKAAAAPMDSTEDLPRSTSRSRGINLVVLRVVTLPPTVLTLIMFPHLRGVDPQVRGGLLVRDSGIPRSLGVDSD